MNSAVRHLLDGVATRAGLTVLLRSSVPDQLPPQIAIALYRAIHEGITNVVRHARATELDVVMERDATGLVCIVRDNGVGLASGTTQPAGLGLRGIRDRLKGLHGELEMTSARGRGTEMIISIPIPLREQSDGN